MPIDSSEYKEALDLFRMCLGLVTGATNHIFRDGEVYNPTGGDFDGTIADDPMREIGSRIYDTLDAFNHLQQALGLPDGERPRFERALMVIGGDPEPPERGSVPSAN